MIKSLITEYGIPWTINRSLYSLKLKSLNYLPFVEKLFEKEVSINRIDIFDFNKEQIEKFLLKLPDDLKQNILVTADDAIEGKIKVFSSVKLDYGNPINWHYNPITKVQVDKNLKWFQIPDFDSERGDIKVIWEASRFTHFYSFIRAYLLTKNKKYYNAFSNQLENWMHENQYSFGPNYKCGQEAALRMINALITYSAFESCGLTTKKDKQNIYKLVKDSYKKVLSNFFYAHKCIKNNHTISEIIGLIIGAWCSQNHTKLQKSLKLLNSEIEKQFTLDGGYIQNSFNYQRLALQLIEFIISIGKKIGFNLSSNTKEIILNSIHQLYQFQDESGKLPNRGANDGALLFPVTSCDYQDFRSIINSISCLINKERMYKSGPYDEEALWFLNGALNELPVKDNEKKSNSYIESGLYSLRKSRNTFMMVILKDNKTRPSQMDQLHVDLWHNGINIFCDTGSYSYAHPIGQKLSLTASHNTVKVNGLEQMNKRGNFLVTDWSISEKVTWTKDFFKGTMISKNGYRHTRSVKLIDSGYEIIDEVTGKKDMDYCEFNFHTPLDIKEIKHGINLYLNQKLICQIITEGEINIKKAFRSLFYLRKEEIYCISIKKNMGGNYCKNKVIVKLFNNN